MQGSKYQSMQNLHLHKGMDSVKEMVKHPIRSFVWPICRRILNFYSYYSRRKANLWVFGAWRGCMYADNPKYLFEYVNAKHPEIEAVWITKNEEILKKVRALGYRAELASTPAARRICLHAGAVFMNEGQFDVCEECLGGALLVQMWHGMGLKLMQDIGMSNKSSLWRIVPWDHSPEHWMLSCQEAVDWFGKIFGLPPERLFVTGSPRLDNLKRRPMNAAFEKLKQERAGERLVIYAPTHRGYGFNKKTLISQEQLVEIDKRLGEMKVTMIFKPHRNELHSYQQYKLDLHHIILATNDEMYEDVYTYLHYMDAMIADYSSVFLDYTCVDRPVIFYVYDIDDYKKGDSGLVPDFEQRVPGPLCMTWEETLDALEKELRLDTTREKRHAFCAHYNPLNDGQSCRRVCEKTKELLQTRTS